VKRSILLHYHEINLKKNNRGWFESRLQQHLERLLHDLPHGGIRRRLGRVFVDLNPDSPVESIETRLARVFGIANLCVAWEVAADIDEIKSALAHLIGNRSFASFKIDARRGTKDFPLNSQAINEDVGAFVQNLTGAAVRMDGPDLTCFVEIIGPRAYLYFEKIQGGGGLPTATGGHVLCLISGGIDSPVAAFRMMRRGCQVAFIHFHSFPHTTLESQEKVRRIVQVLSRSQLDSSLCMVPFAEVQREIVAFAPAPLRVLLYRRFMLRIAAALAQRQKALALVTGDSLGQVASQTLMNIASVSAATQMPIFRPLIGDDKEDIVRVARFIGTYEISILPDQDCCTIFVPRHPETMSNLDQIEKAEIMLDCPRLAASALESATYETILPDYSPAAFGVV
jgi:thiamine biosynthesis protein ThiI